LSAIQPEPRVPNIMFVKDDAEAPGIFPLPTLEGHQCEGQCEHRIEFDYIHLRAMFSCFNDPRVIMKKALENLAPGGWIEFQDTTFQTYQHNPDFEGKYTPICLRTRKYIVTPV
jgi:hypothetical protein